VDAAEIKTILEQAVDNLFTNQSDIFTFTSQTHQTEWNLAHHLAVEIHEFFSTYNCDIDVTKPNLGNKRPDIIIHKRGSNEHNFLVIEMKLNGDSQDTKDDIDKIKANWFRSALRYQFGAVINIKSDKTKEVKSFKNPAHRS
jgi:hypothetical protein